MAPRSSFSESPFSVVATETCPKMDIFSALRSWRSKGSKIDLNAVTSEVTNKSSTLSPRFKRWGSVKRQSTKNRQRRHSSKLSVCRENQSQSLPSSVCGDSIWDLKVNHFQRDEYLDPFQGKNHR